MDRITVANLTCQKLQNVTTNGCDADFDRSLCWFNGTLGAEASQPCPFPKLCSSCEVPAELRTVTRRCLPNGIWAKSNYTMCRYLYMNTSCVERTCFRCSDDFLDASVTIAALLSILSSLALIAAVSLFFCLKSIHCRRLTIHAHLACSFILRFVTITIWILMNRDELYRGCATWLPKSQGDVLCKITLFMIMYTTLASTFWMFVEGAYLVSRFTIYAMRASEGPLWLYIFVGWVVPAFLVTAWAVFLETQKSVQFCWLPYSSTGAMWILVGPLASALVVNVLFLISVIVVLIQKVHVARTSETAKIWQTIKATLLLVPLLGVTNLLLFYEPAGSLQSLSVQVYMLVTAVLQHSQGIFVAVLYCFANGEVQGALKRAVKKFRLTQQVVKKRHRAKSYTVVSTADVDVGPTACNTRSTAVMFTSPGNTDQVRILHQSDQANTVIDADENGTVRSHVIPNASTIDRPDSHESSLLAKDDAAPPTYSSCVIISNSPVVSRGDPLA